MGTAETMKGLPLDAFRPAGLTPRPANAGALEIAPMPNANWPFPAGMVVHLGPMRSRMPTYRCALCGDPRTEDGCLDTRCPPIGDGSDPEPEQEAADDA